MGNEYSIDLRTRVVKYVEEGGKKTEASRIFQVSRGTVQRWVNEYKEKGGIKERTRKEYKTRKIDKEKFLKYIKEHPEAILEEIAQEFKVRISAVEKACKRWKITRKKNSTIQRKKRRREKAV